MATPKISLLRESKSWQVLPLRGFCHEKNVMRGTTFIFPITNQKISAFKYTVFQHSPSTWYIKWRWM